MQRIRKREGVEGSMLGIDELKTNLQRVKDVLGYKTGSRGLGVQARTAANNDNDCGVFVVKFAEGAVRAEAVAEWRPRGQPLHPGEHR